MEKKKKAILIVIIILIILIVTSIIVYLGKRPKETKNNIITNNSDNFRQIKEYQDLSLSNIVFNFKENESIITGTLTNKSLKKIENTMIEVILLDEQKSEKGIIYIYLDSIEGGEDKTISGSIDQNYIDAFDCYIRY